MERRRTEPDHAARHTFASFAHPRGSRGDETSRDPPDRIAVDREADSGRLAAARLGIERGERGGADEALGHAANRARSRWFCRLPSDHTLACHARRTRPPGIPLTQQWEA